MTGQMLESLPGAGTWCAQSELQGLVDRGLLTDAQLATVQRVLRRHRINTSPDIWTGSTRPVAPRARQPSPDTMTG